MKGSGRSFYDGQESGGFKRQQESYDVCVIGGGMAGICAAVASARTGVKTVLVHDRPVLGGNASSEVRMWICGAHGPNLKEAGILEEIQLANCHRNPYSNYSIWDSVLYEKVAFCPNLTLMLNATCTDARCSDGRIEAIDVWQLTSQTRWVIEAKTFVDCSGDSILAPLTGALHRWGRESREEFGEDIQPEIADGKTMGNSLLLQIRKFRDPEPFIAPKWAYEFDDDKHIASRVGGTGIGHNYWWLEVGGLNDTIHDAEAIRHELMCISYGIWDYFKNRAPLTIRKKVEPWSLEWVGSLPGKRESRRYVGPKILTQNDVAEGGKFEDVVAYGGWSMDDHHPGGLLYPGKATLFHPAPAPYGIPFGTLYSANVSNLMFAGRNVSVTHAALSSTRVMGTTSLLGQAAGTAAALCSLQNCSPSELRADHIRLLQRKLMDDDCWLPGFSRESSPLTREADLSGANHDQLARLRNGDERSTRKTDQAWEGSFGDGIELNWKTPRAISRLRMVLDSDLSNSKQMGYQYEQGKVVHRMPSNLLRDCRIESRKADGDWEPCYRLVDNLQRLVRIPLNRETTGLRIIPESSWGGASARIFSVDALTDPGFTEFAAPSGRRWSEVVAEVSSEDLAVPGKEADGSKMAKVAA